MPDTKITALTAISTVDPAADPLVIVDVSDTSMAASGTTKKITSNQILGAGGTATLASATITGNLTVDTNTFFVDSANNRVGIVNSSPAYPLDVVGNINTNSEIYSTGGRLALYRTAGASYVDHASGQDLVFRTVTSVGGGGPSELMRLNSTGLGVGTVPSYKLHVFSASPILGIQDSSSAAGGVGGTINFLAYTSGTSGANIEAQIKGVKSSASSAGELQFFTSDSSGNSQQRLLIDGSGNVGIGVTPSAWVAGAKALQFGAYGALAQSSSGNIELSFNSYNSGAGAYKYLQTDTASLYRASSVHSWFVAPSGTAGNAITFTEAMTLDASGRLILLASTTTPATLSTNGQLTFTATSNTNLRFSYRGSDGVTRTADITLA